MKCEKWLIDGLFGLLSVHGGRYLAKDIAEKIGVTPSVITRWAQGRHLSIDDDAGARLVQFLAAEGIRPPQPKGGGLEDDRDSSVLAALVDRWPELSRSKRHLVAGTIMGLLGAINGQEKHAH
jgi:transcriptional regulator with XRE-family HTH domain